MKIEVKNAIIVGIVAMAWTPLEYIFGLHSKYFELHKYVTNLFLLVPIFFIYKTMVEKKKLYAGSLTYEKAFRAGVLMSIIVIPFAILGQFTYYRFINPGYFTLMIDRTVLAAHGAGQDPIQALAEAQEKFSFNRSMLQSALGPLFGGIVFSSIIAFFVRTKNALQQKQS